MAWVVTPITPYEGQTNLDIYTRFTWSKVWLGIPPPDPTPSSWIWIADDRNLTINLQKIEVPINTFYDLISPLNKETGYYWGVSVEELTLPTTVFKFTTGLFPDQVLLLTPFDEATGESLIPTLTWNAAVDADTYELIISKTDSSGSYIVYERTGLTDLSHDVEITLENSTEYIWVITGKNDNGNYGPTSEAWTFTTLDADPITDPVLLYPLNTDVNVPRNPLFDWTDVYGVEYYSYEVARDVTFLDIVASGSSQISQYQLPFYLDYNKLYYWRVKAFNNTEESNWVTDTFTTKAEPAVAIPSVYDPTAAQTDFDVPGTIKWNYFGTDLDDLTFRIQITLQTDPTWASLFDEAVVSATEYFVYQPTMDYAEDYMVRVRAETTTQTGDWSTVVNFTTENEGLPEAPSFFYPVNGDNGVGNNPNIQWTSQQFADSYNLQIAEDANFNNIIANPTGLTQSQYVASLASDTEYWIRVRSYNIASDYWSAFSVVVHFTTIQTVLPTKPYLISPYNFESNVDKQPMFLWGTSANSETYQIQVSTESDFSVNVINLVGLTDNFLACPIILDYEGKYYWRVRGENSVGSGDWSVEWSFKVIAEVYIKTPILIWPYDNAGDIIVLPQFEWRAPKSSHGGGQTSWGFEIQVSSDSGFNVIIAGETNIQVEYHKFQTPLSHNTQYWWRVRQREGSIYSEWAEPWTFITEKVDVPAKPVIYMPEYGEEVIVKPTIKWYTPLNKGVDVFLKDYTLQVSKDIGFRTIDYTTVTTSQDHTLLSDLDNNNFYYVRVKARNSTGYSIWSDTIMFYTEPYSGPTPETMDLQIQMKIDVLNRQVILTDLIGLGGGYVGVTVDELRGLFKLTGPTGVVYENPGWDTDDFSQPDTTGATGSENWATDSMAMPTDSVGKIATGEYQVEYKLREDAGGTVISTDLTKIMWLYEGITPVIDYSIEIVKSRMLISDNSVYDFAMFGSQLMQLNDLDAGYRTWIVRFPIGAGFVSTTRHEQQIYVGPNLWSGNYDVLLESIIKYNTDIDSFLQVEFSDTIEGKEDKIYVSRNGCMTDVLACLEVLTSRFEFAKTQNLNTRDAIKNMIEQIMTYYNMYNMALLTGKDTDYACNRLKDLLAQADCSCAEEYDDVSIEITPVIPPDPGEGSTAGFYKYEFIATEGQQSFSLPITLTDDCPVFVNGNLLADEDYSGIDTQTLILTTPASRYDVVVVFKYE